MVLPAEPLLASNIWQNEAKAHGSLKDSTDTHPAKLPTGIKAIDQAFEGGLSYGQVHCITSQPDHGAQGLVQILLKSHLLSTPNAVATVIDSTQAFDVRRLYHSLEVSLQGSENAGQDALRILKRLKLSQVFDFVGLTETMAELHDGIDSRVKTAAVDSMQTAQKAPRSTIRDSDDEEDLLDKVPSAKEVTPAESRPYYQPVEGLLIVDNLSQLMAPLSKNSYAQGQAMLSSFMRSLGHLTRANALCTIVLANASTKPAAEGEGLSLFRSCTIRPATGNSIGYLVDVHMFLHELPRKAKAKAEGEERHAPGTPREMVRVLEIVQDRHGGRFGKWAPFVCDAAGELAQIS